jgi:hypothetical protein
MYLHPSMFYCGMLTDPERGVLRGSGLLIKYLRLIRGKLQSKWLVCLCLLLAADLAFIVLDVLLITDVLYIRRGHRNFSLGGEHSYPETFQHFKEALITLLLVILALRVRSFLYFGWSLLFLYLWLDDTLSVHETLGDKVGEGLGLPSVFGLPPDHIGEVVVGGCFGLLFLIVIAAAYRFSYDPVPKQRSQVLLMLLAVFVFFAVAIDVVDSIAYTLGAGQLAFLLYISEDGGEMVAMSILVWFVVLLTAEQQGASRVQNLRSRQISSPTENAKHSDLLPENRSGYYESPKARNGRKEDSR